MARRRHRPPEVEAALEQMKRDIARTVAPRGPGARPRPGSAGPGPGRGADGPMVERMLDLASRHVQRRNAARGPKGPDGPDARGGG